MGQRPSRLESDYPDRIRRNGRTYVFDKKRVSPTKRGAQKLRRMLQREAKRQKQARVIDGYRVPQPKHRLIRDEGVRGGYAPGYIVLKYVR